MIYLAESLPKPDLTDPLRWRAWTGEQLARWAAHAVKVHPAARQMTEPEQDALAQDVALSVLRADRDRRAPLRPRKRGSEPTRARDVLAWIDYVQSRTDRGLMGMDAPARAAYLRRAVWSALENGGYRDSAERHKMAKREQRERVTFSPLPDDPSGSRGLMAQSVQASSDLESVADASLPDLMAHAADALASERGWTYSAERYLTAALVRAACVALRTDAAVALAEIARQQDRTLHAIRCDASRGSALLADVPAAELAGALRAASAAYPRTEPAEDVVQYGPDRLPYVAAAAADAVLALARAGGSWDASSIHSDRKMPTRPDRAVVMIGPWLQRWMPTEKVAA